MTVDVLDKPEAGTKAKSPAKGNAVQNPLGHKAQGIVQVEAGKLAHSLKVLAALVEKRNTVPILSCVRMIVRKDGITLTGTDLDIWASDIVAVNCHASEIVAFKTCVSAHKLHEAMAALPADANVTLTKEANRLRVEADSIFGTVSYRLPALPIDDFPDATGFEPSAEFEIPAFAIAQGFDAVRHAISSEETRYYLNGIFAHVRDGELLFAATDGHRMARHVVARGDEVPDGAAPMPDAIIARRTVALITQIIDNLDSKAADETDVAVKVSAGVSGGKIAMTIGTVDLVAKLIDGTFPDYARVIPTGNDKLARVKPSHLTAAIKQAMLVSGEKTRAIKCGFEGSRLTIDCMSPDNGDASATMRSDYHSDPLTIGFNARYLLDIVARMGGEEMQLHLADASAPTLIRSHDTASTIYVLMPMRV